MFFIEEHALALEPQGIEPMRSRLEVFLLLTYQIHFSFLYFSTDRVEYMKNMKNTYNKIG
ncbi:hypothetical protein [Enterococcus phage vB_EfaS_Ef5.1]|nr:hypothetical protein [Enterococcus phage vB_EfaS_Ef5.1]